MVLQLLTTQVLRVWKDTQKSFICVTARESLRAPVRTADTTNLAQKRAPTDTCFIIQDMKGCHEEEVRSPLLILPSSLSCTRIWWEQGSHKHSLIYRRAKLGWEFLAFRAPASPGLLQMAPKQRGSSEDKGTAFTCTHWAEEATIWRWRSHHCWGGTEAHGVVGTVGMGDLVIWVVFSNLNNSASAAFWRTLVLKWGEQYQ